MVWIWQNGDWPEFRYDKKAISSFETEFLHKAGILYGSMKHMGEEDKLSVTIELISEEAVKTSKIEGEILDRNSVQSSIQRQLGLKPSHKKGTPAEEGVSKMMVDLYKTWDAPLTHETLYYWHTMLMDGQRSIRDIGRYRTHEEPMQIVSARLDKPEVHYEAPPSKSMKREMAAFIAWFNKNEKAESALVRSGIAHLYFEAIHPFEDGNGRIGRAVSEKALSQNLGRPTLIALAQAIEANRKAYYSALQLNSQDDMEITDWLGYFAKTVLAAQDRTQKTIDFLIAKTKFYDRFSKKMNERQKRVIDRIFKEGIDGFKGGLSAENYMTITKAPRATTTRDLQALVEMGAFTRTGELRYTRYNLNLPVSRE